MAEERRNFVVLGCLATAMTLTAGFLLWIEPARQGWTASPRVLQSAAQAPVVRVLIDYAPVDVRFDPEQYELVLFPDGQRDWRPNGPLVRALVVGSDAADLPEAQARTLLAVIGSLRELHGLPMDGVSLTPQLASSLDPQSVSVADLLMRKGLLARQ
ncbi:MAG: hypothetical protein KDA32_12010 [Phycisphaerales bacterium]|nr:hypothetical protein [Phycisphaerales bacterium]